MFEGVQRKRAHRDRRVVAVSILFHLLLAYGLWRHQQAGLEKDDSQKPVKVTFLSPPPPPPPPPPGGHSHPQQKKHEIIKPIKPKQFVQPKEIPKEVPKPPEPPPEPDTPDTDKDNPDGVEGGVAGGVKGGVVGGVVGGVLGGTLGGTGKRLEFNDKMKMGKLLSGPAIQYTDKAIEAQVEGLMVVRCVLTVAGEVKDCEIQKSLRFMDRAVVDALEKRRYTAVTLEGQPVEVYYTFRLRLGLPH